MEDPNTRFFVVEHPVIMLLAIAFAHIGRSMSTKGSNANLRFKRGTIFFALSLLLMLSRMPWPSQ
jgi:hypothetical protein